jgi:hypothetical protein
MAWILTSRPALVKRNNLAPIPARGTPPTESATDRNSRVRQIRLIECPFKEAIEPDRLDPAAFFRQRFFAMRASIRVALKIFVRDGTELTGIDLT